MPKKWQPELIIAKWPSSKGLGYHLSFGHSRSLRGFSMKKTLKQSDAYGCYGDIFALNFREFKLTKRYRSRPQSV